MRLSSLYKVTQQQGDLDHNSWESVELVTEGFCAWGLGVLAWNREGFLRAEV